MKKLIYFILLILLCNFVTSVNPWDTASWVSYWSHDNADYSAPILSDMQGSNDLTREGATSNQVGQIDESFDYDADSDRLVASDSVSLNPTDITINAWVYLDTWGSAGYGRVVDKGANGHDYVLYVNDATDGISFFVKDKINSNGDSSSLTLSKWYMITVTYRDSDGAIAFYVDGQPSGTATDTSGLGNTGDNLNIGNNGADSREFNGRIDEVAIWNEPLSAAIIEDIYNQGNAGLRLDAIPPSPTIVTVYPQNQTHYNIYNGSIVINTTDIANCDISDANWVFTENSSTQWRWDRVTTPDNNYSITINCSDYTTETSTTLNFVVDTIYPVISVTSPLNNSVQANNLWVNVSYSDTNLYRANTTIFRSDNTIMYNNYSGDLYGTTYSSNENLDISGWNNGFYTLQTIATDDHTIKEFNENLRESVTEQGNEKVTRYNMKQGNIRISYDKDVNMNTIKSTDRWRQEFTYDNLAQNRRNLKITIEAEKIIYREESKYACHLIINDIYWYDCEGLNVTRVMQNNNKITFWYDRSEESDLSESIGGLNIVEENRTFQVTRYVSLENIDFKVNDFVLSSLTYITVGEFNFNLSSNKTLTMFGSTTLEKVTGGGTSDVYMRVTINGVELFDNVINSLTSNDDIKSTGFPIFQREFNKSNNNVKVELRRSGNGNIQIKNFEGRALSNTTNDNEEVKQSLSYTNIETVFTSGSEYNKIASYTIDKYDGFKTRLDIDHKVSATSAQTVSCYLNNTNTTQVTPTYTRYLSASGQTGSTGLSFISNNNSGLEQWDLYCQVSSSTTLTSNASVYLIDLTEDDADTINSFQCNTTNINGITGLNNLIMTDHIVIQNGTHLEVEFTAIIQSTTGTQDNADSPLIYINSPDVNTASCYIETQRSLSDNTDIGTVKMYMDCGNVNISQNITINAYLNVVAGESVNLLMGSINAIEVIPETVSQINIPPTVTINYPVNTQSVSKIVNINWTMFDFNSDTILVNLTFINYTDTTQYWNLSLNDATNTYSLNTSLYPNGFYYINATVWETTTPEHYTSYNSIYIEIQNDIPPVIININGTYLLNCSVDWNTTSVNYKICQMEENNMTLSIILAILGFCSLMLFIAFKLETIHAFLKLLLIFVVVTIQIVTGKVILLITSGTTYESIGLTFYVAIIWFIRFFWIYVFIFLVYHTLDYFGKLPTSIKDKGWKA